MYTKKLLSVFAACMMAATAFAQTPTTDPGVVINGVKWATRNVDAPGLFVDTPQDAGMFYQWNRNIGWSATDPLVNSNGGTTWDATEPEGTEWEAANDPSPEGWRVPTKDEIETLLDASKVSSVWTTQDGVNGYLFTDKTTNATLFLPAAGCRHVNSGSLTDVNWQGLYWSSTQDNAAAAYSVYVYNGGAASQNGGRNWGFSVRPVSTATTALADVQAAAPLQISVNNGTLTIASDPSNANTITIADLQGRTIVNYDLRMTKQRSAVANYDGNTATINVSALPKGVYLVRVGNRTSKLIINN
jgi:uncharacterized protein (TIGR02145 family)